MIKLSSAATCFMYCIVTDKPNTQILPEPHYFLLPHFLLCIALVCHTLFLWAEEIHLQVNQSPLIKHFAGNGILWDNNSVLDATDIANRICSRLLFDLGAAISALNVLRLKKSTFICLRITFNQVGVDLAWTFIIATGCSGLSHTDSIVNPLPGRLREA